MSETSNSVDKDLSETAWLPGARKAIKLSRKWARKVSEKTNCQVLLFGSAIYKNGEQFEPTTSDLDIVCIFPESADALGRVRILKALLKLKLELETKMIPVLNRSSCDEPGVSIVALTKAELRADVHKSGVRLFFKRNYFYDFSEERARFLEEAGMEAISEQHRQALEYVQKIRNQYLAVSANDVGGLKSYVGPDPVPKGLMRVAAQLNQDAEDGEWYDTMLGLELIQERVRALRDADIRYRRLADCLSVRRGARGAVKALSPGQQILLNEIIVEETIASGSEDVVNFTLRLIGVAYNVESVIKATRVLADIAPGAKVAGIFQGSIILQIWAPLSTFKKLQRFAERRTLEKFFEVDAVELSEVRKADYELLAQEQASRVELLVSQISSWTASDWTSDSGLEKEFFVYLKDALEKTPGLSGASLAMSKDIGPWAREADFQVGWASSGVTEEVVAIELTRATSATRVFDRLTHFQKVRTPLIFALVGGQKFVDRHASDLKRFAELNANIKVVAVPVRESLLSKGS